MEHFQIVNKGKILITIKVTNIIKKLKTIHYVSPSSVIPLLCNVSSGLAAVLVCTQFLSVGINKILKIRNIISILAVFQITGFPILKKQKT